MELRCQQVAKARCNPDGLLPYHIFMNLFHMVVPGIGVTLAPCYGHGISRQPQACDLDVTGTPCQDFAPNGHRLGVHGPQWSVCLAWISLMLLHQVPVIVHENVP